MKFDIRRCLINMLAAVVLFYSQNSFPEGLTNENLKSSGYMKNIFSVTKVLGNGKYVYADTQRLRLKGKYKFSRNLKAVAIYDNEFVAGTLVKTSDFDLVRGNDQHDLAFIDGDKAYYDEGQLYMKHSLYRAYIEYIDPKLEIVAGKQRIDWGRTRFWSPLDLFNPINQLSLEREETIGVDAISATVHTGPLSSIQFVYAPRRDHEDTSFGSKLYMQVGEYDLFFTAGQFKKDTVLGACFDGYLWQAGVRGEFSYTSADNGRDYFRTALGVEYGFQNNLTLLAEYFYNGGFEDNQPSTFLNSYNFSSRALTMKRHLIGLFADFEATPLLNLYNTVIYDVDGGSFFINPEIKYNLTDNIDLSLGIQFFTGGADSEFGLYENIYYAIGQYYF